MNFICSYGTPFILDLKVNQGGRKLGGRPLKQGGRPLRSGRIYSYTCAGVLLAGIYIYIYIQTPPWNTEHTHMKLGFGLLIHLSHAH